MACYRDDLHHLCRLTPKLAPCWFPWQEAIGRIVVFFRCKAGFSSLSFYLCLFLMCVFVRIVPLITAPSSAARYSMWPVWMSCRNSSPWTASRSQSASLGESPPPEHCRTTSTSSKPELFLKCLLLHLAIWTLTSRLDKELKEAAENSK